MQKIFSIVFVLAVTPTLNLNAQSTAYAVDQAEFPTIKFVSFPIPAGAPFTTILAPFVGGTEIGGDFGPDGKIYIRGGDGSLLGVLEPTLGTVTTVDTITGVNSGQTITGMGFNHATGTMYLASTSFALAVSELYTVDLTTAAATFIGTVTNAADLFTLAVNGQGEIYGFDAANDNLIKIDPASGAGTIIGSVGVNVRKGSQDTDFDPATGDLYWASHNGVMGELRTVDITTGNSTLVTTWSAELSLLAIAADSSTTSIEQGSAEVPDEFELSQNYPNPFNPTTLINYQAPTAGHVELKVYNTLGQEIRTLANSIQSIGTHQAAWDGRDSHGNVVPSGVYFYQLKAGSFVKTRKMLFIR